MSWPPANDGPAQAGSEPPLSFPPDGWPRKSQIEYATALLLLGLLLLSLPWLVIKLLTNPEEVFAAATRRAMLKGGP